MLNITQSNFTNNYAYYQGGSVSASESSVSIFGSKFTNNVGGVLGGVISIANQSSLTIEDSSVVNNTALYGVLDNGGGIFLSTKSTMMISNVKFLENKAKLGGAVYIQILCNITILQNSSFVGNRGSAISLVNNNTLIINDSVFYSNSRAIFGVLYCNISIMNTNFIRNKASDGGSIRVSRKTSVYLQSCSFTNNCALDGGVMNVENSTINVLTCNFTGNMAADGNGAVAHLAENNLVNINDSTFIANVALGLGGVLWIRNSTVNVREFIIFAKPGFNQWWSHICRTQ